MLFGTIMANAQTFQPNVIVKQSNITTNTNVEVGINLVNFPCLEPLQVDPNYALFQNGNQLELVIAARGASLCNPIPLDNPPYHFYDIGKLNVGNYNLQVRVVFFNTLLLPFANDGFLFGNIQNIQANIAVIPTLDFVGMFVFILLFLLIAKTKFNKRNQKITMALILMVFVSDVFAEKVFHVLLSYDENAPSPDAVVAESNISPPPPQTLLLSFNAIRPNSVDYVISERPTGDLANFIEAHPKWALSRLYRYVVVSYDDSVDEVQLKSTLSQDQYIEGAIYLTQDSVPTISAPPPNIVNNTAKDIKSVKGLGTGIVNSYLNDLGIPSAWELSEGSGYIGVVDTGIEVEHHAFKAFDSNGNYLGGNLLDYLYSIDFGEGDLNVDEQQPIAITVDQSDCEDPNNPGFALPRFVGHGTHVSGILAANNSVSPENGICKNCGLSVMKYYRNTVCGSYLGQPSFGAPFPDNERAGNIIDSMKTLSSIGVGIISYSGGIPNAPANFCENLPVTDPEYPFCVAIEFLAHRNSLLIAAAGNN